MRVLGSGQCETFSPGKKSAIRRDSAASCLPWSSWLISAYICIVVWIGFLISSEQMLHWFVIPVLACGVVIGVDAVNWLRGRLDIFDPIGIVGLLGFHFFFLAPMLHVHWDLWMRFITPPDDWRPWLGGMALLNFGGLLIYRLSRMVVRQWFLRRLVLREWILRKRTFFPVLLIALIFTCLLQFWVYARTGGFMGYLHSLGTGEFIGMGWIFMMSESFPILAFMGYAVRARENGRAPSWSIIILVVFIFIILKLFFGGMRGSRSNTIWGVFWAVGIVHFWLRPVPRWSIGLGLVMMLVFMFFYGFFKAVGTDASVALRSAEARMDLEQSTGRTFRGLLLGDLGRSDIQAFLLFRLSSPGSDFRHALGQTYIGAVSLLIPEAVWPDRPLSKGRWGTDAQYGFGTFDTGIRHSTRIYALAGEAMLNFGIFFVPFAFIALGIAVGYLGALIAKLPAFDIRWLILPLLINVCFSILSMDSDNLVFILIKNGALPVCLLWLCSSKVLRQALLGARK